MQRVATTRGKCTHFTLNREIYFQEIQKSLATLIGVGDVLRPLNLPRPLFDQVTFLRRGVARKDKYLASNQAILSSTQVSLSVGQIDLKALCLENAFMVHILIDCSISSLMNISESFENANVQVELFHYPLHISREKIRSNQMLKDGRSSPFGTSVPFFYTSVCCKI